MDGSLDKYNRETSGMMKFFLHKHMKSVIYIDNLVNYCRTSFEFKGAHKLVIQCALEKRNIISIQKILIGYIRDDHQLFPGHTVD